MAEDSKSRFCFAGFTLDLNLGRLLGIEGDVALRPKSFALLAFLVRNSGRVVSKDELLSQVWPDVFVTEDSLTQCIHDIRRALGKTGQDLLRTLPRRGYLFSADFSPQGIETTVNFLQSSEAVVVGNKMDEEAKTPVLRHDGIAILPFTSSGSWPSQDLHLLDGLTHDIISRLSRLKCFHVIARGSTFALRHLASDPAAVGRSMGVAYVVSGNAEISGPKVRIRCDIVEVETSTILWTEEIVEKRQGFVEIIGQLTERIAQKVNIEVTTSEMRRAVAIKDRPLDAWQFYHAGLFESQRFELERMPKALEKFGRSIDLDPGFARAHAAQSFCHFLHAFIDHGIHRSDKMAASLRAAKEAMRVDESNPSSHWAYGRALWLGGDPVGGLQHLRIATQISPSYALAHYFTGFIEALYGDPSAATAHLDKGKLLSPFDPFAPSMEIMRAMAEVRLGNIEGAAASAGQAARYPNAHAQILAPAAMILAEAGHLESALKAADQLRSVSPNYKAIQLQKTLYGMPQELIDLFTRNAPRLGI